jgi:hypothetical protein
MKDTNRYRCIVADPPWPIGDFPAWFAKDRRSRREKEIGVNPTPYKTMTLPEIEGLRVSDVAADGAHLYLWTTDAFYEAALRVARAWGFEKSATLVWCKKPMGKGMGGAWPSNVEFVLFCRRVQNHGWQEFGAWLRKSRMAAGKTTPNYSLNPSPSNKREQPAPITSRFPRPQRRKGT